MYFLFYELLLKRTNKLSFTKKYKNNFLIDKKKIYLNTKR